MLSAAFRRTLFTLIGLAAAGTASAGTITTWSGTNGNNWSSSGNWTTPLNTSGTFSLVYRGTTASGTSTNNVGAVTVDSILFSNNGTAGQTSQYRLTASGTNSMKLTNGGNVTTTAATSGTLTETITSPIQLLGTGTFNIGSNHNVTMSGFLNSGSLVKTGAGDLTFTGSTSLTGLSVNQGVAQFGVNAYSGINGLQVGVGSVGNSATLRYVGATGTTSTSFSLSGTAGIQLNQSSNLTFSSGTFNAANGSITTPTVLNLLGGSSGNAGTQTVNGVIQDNSGTGTVAVNIGGANTTNVWVLKGANTYTGATVVAAGGKLLMDGVVSGSSTTTSSGYLGGSGTFGGAVAILSGTLAPGGISTTSGTITDSIGTLTVGSLSLSGPATTAMTITGSTAGLYDQIAGSSSITYGGTLALALSGSYADYTTFDLFSGFTSHTGDLSSITLAALGSPYAALSFTGPDGSGDWYTGWTAGNQQLKFSESTGTLTVVPEPSTIVFAGIGMAMFGWSSWTRRRAKARRQAIEAAIA